MISDAIKVVVILKNAPLDVRSSLRLQLPCARDDCPALPGVVQMLARDLAEYNSRGNMTTSTGSNDAMEVDQAYSSKGGKSTGKYGGKRKNSNGGQNANGKTKENNLSQTMYHRDKGASEPKFTGTCHICGKTGHMMTDCWWNTENKRRQI